FRANSSTIAQRPGSAVRNCAKLFSRHLPPGLEPPGSQQFRIVEQPMNCERGQVQSVLRACDILKSFRHESETLLLSDVMDRAGLCKTTAFRLLQTLVKAGLVEQVGKGSYRSRFQPMSSRPVRMGFASQTDSEFCRQVTESLKRAAAAHGVHLITVNNRYSAREALRNADLLIREQVELVLEFQTYE